MELIQLYEVFKTLAENQQFQQWGLGGLFLNAVLSATALPLPTEILTSALLAGGEPKLNIFIVLLVGSVIGGILNYWIGYGGSSLFRVFKKKPIPDVKKKPSILLGKYTEFFIKISEKYAPLAILFSPFILVVGDLILISAGARKYSFIKFIFLMVTGKAVKITITILFIGSLPF